jgi:hypothetical protein
MPLSPDAPALMRKNLETFRDGKKAPLISVGTLTPEQLACINKYRKKQGFPLMAAELVFFGSHVYKRRIAEDGYSIDEVLVQIESATKAEATVINGQKMTGLRNPNKRADLHGNQVRDEVVLECSARYPRAEIFSVVPRGDKKKPDKTEKAADHSAASSGSFKP